MAAHDDRTRMRLAAYGVVVEDDRLLLTLVAEGYPAAGRWTLPGGGVDFGEQPLDGVVREVKEETGLDGEVLGLLDVSTRFFDSDHADGFERFYWVRVLYRVRATGEPHVIDVDGSTAAAEWVPIDEVRRRDTVDVVDVALALLER